MPDPDFTALISTYGYWAVALGCLLEGETVLLLAGWAASRGHLDFAAVVAVAASAGFVGDQIYFWLGRRYGDALLARFPRLAACAPRVHRLLDRRDATAAFGVRFVYGLRMAGPVIIGSSGMAPARFALFNGLGAVVWAVLIAGLGWLFGATLPVLLGELHRFELLLALIVSALAVLAFRYWGGR